MMRPVSVLVALRRAIWPLIIFNSTANLATILLLDPLLVLLLERTVSLGGDPFVGNTALISFAVSPPGMASFAVAGIGVILANVLALGGASLVIWDARQRLPVRQLAIWRLLIWRLTALLAISILTFCVILVLMIPVVATGIAARHWWLSSGDLYFYLKTWPPEFIRVVAAIAAVGFATALAGVYVLLRTSLALPIYLLRGSSIIPALRLAVQATSRRVSALLPRLLLTAAILTLMWALVSAALYRLLEWMLASAPITSAALRWLGMAFAILAALIFAALTSLSRTALLLVLLADTAADDALPQRSQSGAPPPARVRLRLAGALLILLAIPAATVIEAAHANQPLGGDRSIAITAHRAGSARAPENTIAALKTAIAEGANAVEIDAQETADGHVVLLHDTDLRRVAGVARSVWDMRLDELRALDVGSWFSPGFGGERIPTLREFATIARARIGMNVELKNNRRGEDLAARVIAILRETGTSGQTVISSLDLGLLRDVQKIAPEMKTGLILATGLGSLRRVNTDFFALSRRLATPAVIRQIHATGREVHVWTLDDQASIARAMLDGADNIITSDTLLGLKMRRWFQALSEAQQTLLRIELSVPGFARSHGPAPAEP